MKYCISGAGYAARYFVKALGEMGHPVVGITNRTKERGQALAGETGARLYDSVDEMVRRSGADIFIVATSTERHLPDIRAAAEAGIRHIFCEKPAGVSVEETLMIREACEKRAINLGVGYKMRFEGLFSEAQSLVKAGRIGELVSISLNYYQTVPHSAWYLDSGFMRETMVHTIDMSCWLAEAPPESVVCRTENFVGGKKEDRALLLLRYGNGITATLMGGWIRDYPYITGRKNICFEIVGTGGYICGVRPGHLMLCDADGIQKINFEPTDPIKMELTDFEERCKLSQPATVSIDDALRVQATLYTATTSELSGSAETVRTDY